MLSNREEDTVTGTCSQRVVQQCLPRAEDKLGQFSPRETPACASRSQLGLSQHLVLSTPLRPWHPYLSLPRTAPSPGVQPPPSRAVGPGAMGPGAMGPRATGPAHLASCRRAPASRSLAEMLPACLQPAPHFNTSFLP